MQIENVLTANPAVLEAAAVAVPDAFYGEVVGAWIMRDPHTPPISREGVRKVVSTSMNPQVSFYSALYRMRHPWLKRMQNAPRWVWFVGEDGDELPKTASGKVMKHVLRKWSRELAEKGVGKAR